MPLPFQNLTGQGGSSRSPRSHNIGKDVANAPRKEAVNNSEGNGTDGGEVDSIRQKLFKLQDQNLHVLKEDIADWITRTLGDVDITANNFVNVLDTGVVLCRLSMAIEAKAKECQERGELKEPLPKHKLHCNKTAKSGTWFARDNTANFLKWCRAYGMMDESLFDSEDLVAHHQEKQVIFCLMELVRIGARFGLEPSNLVAYETEIEKEISKTQPVIPIEAPVPVEIVGEPTVVPPPPSPKTPPHPLRSKSSSKRSSSTCSRSSASTLDSEVSRVSHKCKCQEYVDKLSEGVYNVFGKRVFIRLLKGKHLMVRVGGGWDTFENYLLHHDPIQVFEFHDGANGSTHSNAVANPNFNPGAFNGYLVIRSKYKSGSFNL